jgi:hypothetical protein
VSDEDVPRRIRVANHPAALLEMAKEKIFHARGRKAEAVLAEWVAKFERLGDPIAVTEIRDYYQAIWAVSTDCTLCQCRQWCSRGSMIETQADPRT